MSVFFLCIYVCIHIVRKEVNLFGDGDTGWVRRRGKEEEEEVGRKGCLVECILTILWQRWTCGKTTSVINIEWEEEDEQDKMKVG